ncbi:MAG: hypothetical protein HC837_06530, partial [Chloroflexaceae bacterium]|nr:hypothetical protein [Chloroflexaceae bacterium]
MHQNDTARSNLVLLHTNSHNLVLLLSFQSVRVEHANTEHLTLLRGGRQYRRYRRLLMQRIHHDPALQLLPELLTIPLLPDAMANLIDLTSQHAPHRLMVRGDLGTGRSLLLHQLAWHWVQHASEPLLWLSLASTEARELSPHMLLSRAANALEQSLPLDGIPAETGEQPWCLLIDDWALLPSQQRLLWRSFLRSLPEIWPEARVVLALPNGDEMWSGWQTIMLSAPDTERRNIWLRHLLPNHDLTPLLAALQPTAPLAVLGERLLDIALLALGISHSHGLPGSRLELYDRAIPLWEEASKQQPPDQSDMPMVLAAQARHAYDVASAIASSGDLSVLTTLEGQTQTEVARLLTAMLDDPTPLYQMLWPPNQPTPEALLTLGRCVRERPDAAADWSMRIVAALAAQQQSHPHQSLMQQLEPCFPTIVTARSWHPHHHTNGNGVGTNGSSHRDHLSDEQAMTLLAEIVPVLSMASLFTLLNDTALYENVRWAAADALAQIALNPTAHAMLTPHTDQPADQPALCPWLDQHTPADRLSQAAYAYLAILAGSACNDVRRLQQSLSALPMLQRVLSHERRIKLASTLMNNARMPAELRTAALKLIPMADDRSTLAMLARACSDADDATRRTALQSLHNREAAQIMAVLQHALLGDGNPPPASTDRDHIMLELLDHLASYQETEASLLLARCVMGETLALVARLHALTLLASRPLSGLMLVHRFL